MTLRCVKGKGSSVVFVVKSYYRMRSSYKSDENGLSDVLVERGSIMRQGKG